MQEENNNKSSILTQYLRNELPPTRMAEIKHLITNDPAWKSTYITLTSTSQGIRHTTLSDLRSQLQSLEADIKKSENNGHSAGDLASPTTSIDESNEKTILENTDLTPADQATIFGIRYTTLHDELKKLKSEEKKLHTETSKKNETAGSGARVVGIRKWWWAVAAGIVGITFYFGYLQPKQRQDELYKKYFVPYEYSGEFRSELGQKLSEHDSLIKQGIAWYVHGEYGKAVQCFEKLDYNHFSEEILILEVYSKIGARNYNDVDKLLLKINNDSIKGNIKYLIKILKK